MNDITIVPISSSSELKKGVKFKLSLYKENPYFVPPLIFDEVRTLDSKRNPSFEVCDAQSFLAYRDGKIVGRVTAIIHRKANEIWNRKVVRFGYIDFIEDKEVSKMLLHTVEEWGKERGMTEIEGPLGFTDWDPEGMLIEGFNLIHTCSTLYNYPYYSQYLNELGYNVSASWKELQVTVTKELPDKFARIAKLVSARYHLRNVKFKTIKELLRNGYGEKVFDLLCRCYAPIYGFAPLTERQVQDFIKTYMVLVPPELVSLVIDEEEKLVAVGISMPSLSKGLQKAKGKLFPLGWWHLLRSLHFRNDVVEMLLIGVDPKYQSKGVNAMLFADLEPIYYKMGFKYAETNPELDTNSGVSSQWDYFPNRVVRRRNLFRKDIL
ncbi:MAG TPA: N-acetyltransferase [Porphyromonadaceae bacterium]|nr:N-acetyltransferase [Porphyromonadaceae bacterium]